MHKDFHLYGTFLAAILAGYSVGESERIAFAAQKVDEFDQNRSKTSYTITEMYRTTIEAVRDIYLDRENRSYDRLVDMSHTWMLHHFMPAKVVGPGSSITTISEDLACGYGTPMAQINQDLIDSENVTPERLGLTMHVLADCFAHEGFCGMTCYNPRIAEEICIRYKDEEASLRIKEHVPVFWSWMLSGAFYFGHGSAGHLPDLSWARYSFSWKYGTKRTLQYRDNPEQFDKAFRNMVQVLRACCRGRETVKYGFDEQTVQNWLIEMAELEARKRCNTIWWNRAVDKAMVEWLKKSGKLDAPWIGSPELDIQIVRRYSEDVSELTTKVEPEYNSIPGRALLSADTKFKELSQEESSDQVFRAFYDKYAGICGWRTAEELEEEYQDCLNKSAWNKEFEDAVRDHQRAAYQALGWKDKQWLTTQIEKEFFDCPSAHAGWLVRLFDRPKSSLAKSE